MGRIGTTRSDIRRAAIAGVVLSLFVIQSLIVALGANFVRKSVDGGGAIVAMAGDYCDSHGGDAAPAPGRHNHSQCLTSCCQSSRDSAILVFVSLVGAPDLVSPSIKILVRGALDEGPPRRLSGWASSWSSRAPPRLS